jgi:hypothetical protein
MPSADFVSAAERIHRSCQRDEGRCRLVFLDRNAAIRSIAIVEKLAAQLIAREPATVVGVYDHRADPEWIADDIDWLKTRLGVA